MNRINPTRATIFIVVLAITGVSINMGINYHRHQRQIEIDKQIVAQEQAQQDKEREAAAQQAAAQAEASRKQAIQDAADEHARFIAQYENTNFIREPSVQLVAVTCATEGGTMNQAVSAALVSRFKTGNVRLTSSFFKPTLITEGVFDDVFNGSGDIFKKLDLDKYLDGLLLARQDVQYSTNADLNNIITADMHLQIEIVPISGAMESQSWTLSAKGTGFDSTDARMQAEERIIKQIGTDTTMSLNESAPNH